MIHTTKLDTDPDDNLKLMLENLPHTKPPQRLVSVTAVQFTEWTRGYIVITEDAPAVKS